MLYLLGHALFRLRMAGTVSCKRLAGAAGWSPSRPAAPFVSALTLLALVVAVLITVIASWSASPQLAGRARGEPSPLEQLEATASTP